MAQIITEKRVLASLSTVNDPDLHKDLVSLGFIEDILIEGNKVSFTVMLTTPACPLKDVIRRDCETALHRDIPEVATIHVNFDSRVRGDSRLNEKFLHSFKNVIAVGSGKGGVGKSTIAVNLAVSLSLTGAKVGLLDADIYGPNIPSLMGVSEAPQQEENSIIPIKKFGIEMMSMGFLIPPNQALVWRGPMINSALNQLLTQVAWSQLDYLVVDLPPGTGDAQMSLAQQVPLAGAVVVTSPQEVSLSDTRRGVDAFRKLEVPIIGVVENMAGDIFGSGGGESAAKELGVAFLGRLPLDAVLARSCEQGKPFLLDNNTHASALALQEIAGRIAAGISVLQAAS